MAVPGIHGREWRYEREIGDRRRGHGMIERCLSDPSIIDSIENHLSLLQACGMGVPPHDTGSARPACATGFQSTR